MLSIIFIRGRRFFDRERRSQLLGSARYRGNAFAAWAAAANETLTPRAFLARMPAGAFAAADADRDGRVAAAEAAAVTAGLFLPLGDTDASGGLDGAEAAALFAALTVPPGSALEAASFAAAAACAVAAKDSNE